MNYHDLAHRFFNEPKKRGSYRNVSVSFEGDTIYSYYTAIGLKVMGTDGKPALLLSDSNVSPTTGKHIRAIHAACPFDGARIIKVPCQYGNRWLGVRRVAERFSEYLLTYNPADLAKANNRREAGDKVYNAERFNALIHPLESGVLAAADQIKARIAEIEAKRTARKPADYSPEAIKRREEEKRRRLDNLLARVPKMSYMDKILAVFVNKSLPADLRAALKQEITPAAAEYEREYSFVWVSGGYVKTSQRVSMKRDTVRHLINRWRTGNLPEGSHAGPYTINSIRPDYIRIGCHKIPMENIEALEAELAK